MKPVTSTILGVADGPVNSNVNSTNLINRFVTCGAVASNKVRPMVTLLRVVLVRFVLPTTIALTVTRNVEGLKLVGGNSLGLISTGTWDKGGCQDNGAP